jgi:hypothetical protein
MTLLKKPGWLLILGMFSALLHAGCAMDVDDVEATAEDSAGFSEEELPPGAPASESEAETPDMSAGGLGPDGDPYEFRGTRGCLLRCSMSYLYCRNRSQDGRVYRVARAGEGSCYERYWRCTRDCYSDTSEMLAEQQ